MTVLAVLCLIAAGAALPHQDVKTAAAARLASYEAKVVGVTDGDTIEVAPYASGKKAPEKIRLYGIDAPERGQAFAARARERVAALAFGRTVTVVPRGKDRYGRILAGIVLPEGGQLGEILVAEGLAWWFRRYAPRESRLEELEEQAREQRLGLWSDAEPTPPWLWRRSGKK